jgi:S-adenosylmethionine hydrolase
MGILTLMTDFGTADYFVAAVKGTVLGLAPGTQIVDVSHEVAPGGVEEGGFLLAATVPWFPAETVHLAVVDPGVGSKRRILVARREAPPAAWVVAPDNGLISALLGRVLPPGAKENGPLWRIWSVERTELFLPGPGQTFHGRDRFAPMAAALLRGEQGEAMGQEIADPVRIEAEAPRRESGGIVGRVVHVDRYGNLVTDIPSDWLPDRPCHAQIAAHSTGRVAGHYAEIPAGEAALLAGSLGTLEMAMRGEDLARRWRVGPGTRVRVWWEP